jgi:hypothetical protein
MGTKFGDEHQQELNKIMRSLKQMARIRNICILAASQLPKPLYETDMDSYVLFDNIEINEGIKRESDALCFLHGPTFFEEGYSRTDVWHTDNQLQLTIMSENELSQSFLFDYDVYDTKKVTGNKLSSLYENESVKAEAFDNLKNNQPGFNDFMNTFYLEFDGEL